jgi:hypothetical protein
VLTDADIERIARTVIDRHGSNAVLSTDRRILRLSRDGHAEAAATWERIQRAIRVLLRHRPDATVNRNRPTYSLVRRSGALLN